MDIVEVVNVLRGYEMKTIHIKFLDSEKEEKIDLINAEEHVMENFIISRYRKYVVRMIKI